MSITVGQFISELAEKSGIKNDDKSLIGILSNSDLSRIELPKELYETINTSLISVTDAKNNHPLIKSHYFAQAYNGLDKEIERIMDSLGIEEDLKQELLSERSSTKRVSLLYSKLSELQAKDTKPSDTEKSLKKQIDDLNKAITEKNETLEAEKVKFQKKMTDFTINNQLEKLLGGYKTIYDTLPPEVKTMSLQALIKKNLQDNDVEMKLTEKGELTLLKKDGSNFYGANNTLKTPQGFFDEIFAQNKILIVNQGNNGQHTELPVQTQNPNMIQSGAAPNNELKELIAKSKADLASTQASII